MSKKIIASSFIPLFLFCQSPQESINEQLLASDKQRSWCIDQLDQGDRFLANYLFIDSDDEKWLREHFRDTATAAEIYKNDHPDSPIFGDNAIYDDIQSGLLSNDNDYLRYCKILADINDVD